MRKAFSDPLNLRNTYTVFYNNFELRPSTRSHDFRLTVKSNIKIEFCDPKNIYKPYVVDSTIRSNESFSSPGTKVIRNIEHNRKFKVIFLKTGEEKTLGISRGEREKLSQGNWQPQCSQNLVRLEKSTISPIKSALFMMR